MVGKDFRWKLVLQKRGRVCKGFEVSDVCFRILEVDPKIRVPEWVTVGCDVGKFSCTQYVLVH